MLRALPDIDGCGRQVIRFVCREGLAEGDRLPSQADLCKLFKTGNRALSNAMQALVGLGLLTRKTRVGTVVADLSALNRIPWMIGVASIAAAEHGPLAFFAMLHHQIVASLAEANCRTMTFLRSRTFHWPHDVRDFPGLADSVDRRALDGLILLTNLNPDEWCRLVNDGVGVCHVGPFADAACGIVIDHSRFVADATRALREAGCRQIAVADVLPQYRQAHQVCATCTSLEPISGMKDLQGGREVAQALLRRPAPERPDGILAADDHSAMGLAEVFAQAGAYRPLIACVTNRQLPLSFALPVRQWELDIHLLVERTVALIQGRLLGRIAPDHVERIRPRAVAPG